MTRFSKYLSATRFKHLITPVMILCASCGTTDSGNKAFTDANTPVTEPTSASAANTPYAMVISNDSELPACNADNNKQLVYVSSSSSFKSCDSGAWVAIDIKGKDGEKGVDGANGTNGLSISSNQLLNAYSTNICTLYSAIESCFFMGGQIVKYSDGSVLLTGSYAFDYYTSPAANNGSSDYDRLASSTSFIIPPTTSASYQLLDWSVSRGSVSMNALFMVYSRSSDAVTIVFDTNGDGAPGSGDEVVHTVVKSNW